jgi:AcrR family transcriptional regulator
LLKKGERVAHNSSRQARPRGRRRAGEDTRSALLDAARVEFTERGFDGATVRSIAQRAGMDPAMVNHWFGGKDGLFVAALQLPVNPEDILRRVLDGAPDRAAERVLRTFLSVWDANGGGALTALVRSVASHEAAARMMREFVSRVVFGRIVSSVAPDQPELRTALCGTQITGLAMVRYVIRLEPLASADHDTVVAAIAPNLQRYLTGALTTG